MELTKCKRCITPETAETVTFDSEGVCSVCRQIEKKEQIDWEARHRELEEIVSQFKGRGLYDCVIPFSGGKDSTFQLWYVVKKLGLKPLVVRYNHWGFRPLNAQNNARTFKKLGVDVVEFTPNWHMVRATMLEALKATGDMCWQCHCGVYAHVFQIAKMYQVPLIIWGESIAEYQSHYDFDDMEEVDEERFNKIASMGITADKMCDMLNGKFKMSDLWVYLHPGGGFKSICLGNYVKWDVREQVEIIKKELGWQPQTEVEGWPPEYGYEKSECKLYGVRDYLKWLKRGFGRTNHLSSIDIRNGRMDRETALKLEAEYDGKVPASLPWFLEQIEITEEEFYDIVKQHVVPPWEFKIPDEVGKPLSDLEA